jgi:hypothetical protein
LAQPQAAPLLLSLKARLMLPPQPEPLLLQVQLPLAASRRAA